MVNLKKLDLFINQLESIPESIGDLVNLEFFNLGWNNLKAVPESFGQLNYLKELNLSNNKITSLTQSISKLRDSLVLFRIRYNPLLEYAEGTNIGSVELENIFGDKLVFDNKIKIFTQITKEAVYQKLDSLPLSWNRDKLKRIVLDSVPNHKMNGDRILNIWEIYLKQYDTVSKKENLVIGKDFGNYIKAIYGIDNDGFKGWKMYDSFLKNTKNLIEAIFAKLLDQHNNKNTKDCQAYIPKLCEAVKWCPDRQFATFQMN